MDNLLTESLSYIPDISISSKQVFGTKKDIRIQRAIKRNNLPLESIQNRISLQMSDNMKKKISDYIITNNTNEENFRHRINKIYSNLLK